MGGESNKTSGDQAKSGAFYAFSPERRSRDPIIHYLSEFPVSFFLAAVAAIASAHWLAYLSVKALETLFAPGWIAAASVAALFESVRKIYQRRFSHHVRWSFVYICGVFFLVDVASIALHHALDSMLGWPAIAMVLLLAGYLLHRERDVLTRIYPLQAYEWMSASAAESKAARSGMIAKPLASATHLIVVLSLPNIAPDCSDGKCTFRIKNEEVDISDCARIADAIERLNAFTNGRSNWQHLLRGVEPHQASLRHVYLVGSLSSEDVSLEAKIGQLCSGEQNTHGSELYVPACEAMLRCFLPRHVQLHRTKAVDFTDIAGLETHLSSIVHQIFRDAAMVPQHARPEVVVETTGAMKSTSIAGAIATLKGMARFQYVSTVSPFPVLMFDIRIDEPPEI